MFNILVLLFGLLASPAFAQNVTCANRSAGDSSNACANTRFTGSAFINFLNTANTWTAQQRFGSGTFLATANYGAGSTNSNLLSIQGSFASPVTTQDAVGIFEKFSNVTSTSGVNASLYAALYKKTTGSNTRGSAIFGECQDVVGGGLSWCEGIKTLAVSTAVSGSSQYGAVLSAGTGTGISSLYAIGVEGTVEVHGGSNALTWGSFNPGSFYSAFVATNGTNDNTVVKSDVAFVTNPYSGQPWRTGFGCYGNNGAGLVGVDDTCFATSGSIPKGIDLSLSTFSISPLILPNNSPIRFLNGAGDALHNGYYYSSSNEFVLGTDSAAVTLIPAPKFVALTGYVKAAGSSAATASATVPLSDISGLGTDVSTALAITLNAAGGVAGVSMPVALPTLSSCGTSPTVDSRSGNRAGKFTLGTGTTTCTVTFLNAYTTMAYCTITMTAAPAAIANVAYISAQSQNGFILSGGTASASYQYTCDGN